MQSVWEGEGGNSWRKTDAAEEGPYLLNSPSLQETSAARESMGPGA